MFAAKRIAVLTFLVLAACGQEGGAVLLPDIAAPRESPPNAVEVGPTTIEPIFRPGVDKVFRCPTPGGAVLAVPGAPECERPAERVDADQN